MPIIIVIRTGFNKKGHIKMVLLYKCYMLNILESVKVLISSSIANIQETARWQFCRNTQFPDFIASLIILSAIGPCPCPSEIDCTLNSKTTMKCCFLLLLSNATIKKCKYGRLLEYAYISNSHSDRCKNNFSYFLVFFTITHKSA